MNTRNRIILTSIAAGIATWVIDGLLDYYYFFKGSTLLEMMITDVPVHELYVRILTFSLFFLLGIITSALFTKLERTRNNLKEREIWLSTTLTSIGDGVIATDMDAKITFINTVAQELTGFSAEEALGRNISDVFKIVNEESGSDVECPVKRVLREGVVVGLANHTELISKDGNRFLIDDSGAPIRDREDRLTGAVLIFRDITEKRHAQKEADTFKQHTANILDCISEGFYTVYDDFTIRYINAASEKHLGVKREDAIGKILFEDILKDARGTIIEENYRRAIENREKISFEAWYRDEPDRRWYQINVYPYDEGIAVYYQDITDRKNSEIALRDSEQQLQSILAATPIGLGIIHNREVKWASNSFLEMTGYDKDHAIGHTTEALYETKEEFELVGRLLYKGVAEGKTGSIDTQIKKASGEKIDVHMRAAAIDPSDLSKGIMVSVLDITDRKRTETALLESEQQLRSILAATPFGLAIMHNRQLRWVSDSLVEMTGYEKEYAIGRTSDIFYESKEEFERVGKYLYKGVAEGKVSSIDTRLVKKSGEAFDVHMRAAAMDTSDLSKGIMVSVVDITDRKKAEIALRDSEQQLKSVLAATPFGLAILHDTEVMWVTNSLVELSGFDKDDIIGSSTERFYETIEEFKRVTGQIKKEIAEGKVPALDTRLITKSGPPIDVHMRAAPIDPEDMSKGLTVSIVDITERKRTEIALRDSEQQLKSIFAATPIGLTVLFEREFKWVSNSFIEMTGYDRDFVIGQTSEFLYDSTEEFIRVGTILYRDTDKGRVGTLDTRIKTADGSMIDVHMRAAALDPLDLSKGITVSMLDITERKNAERALEESEAKYKLLVENLNEGIWAVDTNGKTTFVNSRMAEMLGYSRANIIGETPSKFIKETEDYSLKNTLERRKRGIKEQYELAFVRENGEILNTLLASTPIYNENMEVTGALAGVTDITDRKKAEDRVLHLNRVLRAIMDVNQLTNRVRDEQELIEGACRLLAETRGYYSVWIVLMDENGRVTFAAESGIGDKFSEFIESISHDNKPLCLETSLKYKGETVLMTPDNKCEICSLHDSEKEKGILCKALYHGGRTYGMINLAVPFELTEDEEEKILFSEVADDISFALHSIRLEKQRRVAEQKLANEKERLAVTLESIGDGVIATDNEGRVILLNKVAEELTGWTEAEAFGRSLQEVFDIEYEDTGEKQESPVDKVLASGEIIALANHTTLISKNGTRKQISDSGAPIRDNKDRIVGVVLVFRDVTETRRLQDFAVRAQRLETAGRIAGQVAHDFNNLLGPLMAYPMFIREQLPDNHPSMEFLDEIEQAATHIADINQQLLTLGRRGHYTMEPLNINSLLEKVVAQMKPHPDTLIIEQAFEKSAMKIRGGSAQLMRVFSNLIRNAADAMMDVGTVQVKTENFYVDSPSGLYGRIPRGEYVKVSITDSGCGIPDDALPKIFDPFFTTKTVNKSRGSGLGLSVVHAVLEDHGAHIDCSTKEGEGTTFYVYLPVSRDELSDTIKETISGGTDRILVVDDDESQRNVTQRLLEKLGYEVTVVKSGEAALAALKESEYELMVLDMIMPDGIDGTETYRRALKMRPDQKAIIVSGYAETDRVQEALALGAGDYVRKPLSLKSISKAVRRELDKPVKNNKKV